MKTFKDNKGRSWTIDINIATVKRVMSELDVNLMEALSGKLIRRLQADVILCVNIIYVLCKKEADERNVSDEDFGLGLAGDALNDAVDAFHKELADFFPTGERKALHKAIEKFNEVKEKTLEMTETYLDSEALAKALASVEGEAKKKIDNELLNITTSPGSSQGSSESTQAD